MTDQHEARAREVFTDHARAVGVSEAILREIHHNGYGASAIAAMLTYADERTTALTAENVKLREALKPFAKAGELFDPRTPGGWDQLIYNPAAGPDYQIVGDDLRRARAALNGGTHAR